MYETNEMYTLIIFIVVLLLSYLSNNMLSVNETKNVSNAETINFQTISCYFLFLIS